MATSIYKILKKLATKINKVEEIASEIDPITDEEIDRAFNSSMSGKWIGLLNSEEYIELAKMMAEEYDQITYLKGEWCWHNNNLYEATVNISTPEAFNIDHWFLLYSGDTPIEITDLTDTVWYLNETLDFTGITYKTYDLDGLTGGYDFSDYGWEFYKNNNNQSAIYVIGEDIPIYDETNNAKWEDFIKYRIVRITGGNDATDTDLIDWFKNNGQFIEEGNLLTIPYDDGTSKTESGVTFTVSNDGTVTANGTATLTTSFNLMGWTTDIAFEGGTYVLDGCLGDTTSTSAYRTRFTIMDDGEYDYYDYGKGLVINYGDIKTSDATMCCSIVIYSGYTASNITFNPILIKID